MTYPYTPQWKDEVSKTSDEWRHYCECFNLAKRFLSIIKTQGKKSADNFLLTYLSGVSKKRGERAEGQLKRDIKLVFEHEKTTLDAAVIQSIHLADAA